MDIVVGYIESPEGEAALERAIEEARLRSGRLVVVHSKKGGDDRGEDYARTAAALAAIHERLESEGVAHEIREFVRGNTPAEDLMEAARTHEAELIVIGIRARSATGKLVLGSTALDILHDSPVAVLCVKA
ncbi:universal stress protein [soil metagenome]